jgi:hypothetical protein
LNYIENEFVSRACFGDLRTWTPFCITDGAAADGKWINSRSKGSIIETEKNTLEIFLVFA